MYVWCVFGCKEQFIFDTAHLRCATQLTRRLLGTCFGRSLQVMTLRSNVKVMLWSEKCNKWINYPTRTFLKVYFIQNASIQTLLLSISMCDTIWVEKNRNYLARVHEYRFVRLLLIFYLKPIVKEKKCRKNGRKSEQRRKEQCFSTLIWMHALTYSSLVEQKLKERENKMQSIVAS